jgi:hypothetical protein
MHNSHAQVSCPVTVPSRFTGVSVESVDRAGRVAFFSWVVVFDHHHMQVCCTRLPSRVGEEGVRVLQTFSGHTTRHGAGGCMSDRVDWSGMRFFIWGGGTYTNGLIQSATIPTC